MPEIKQTDGTVTIAVPSSQTWNSGDIRATTDGRYGVVANGPAKTEGEIATLHCGADIEVEVTTAANLTAGLQAGFTLATQQAAAADGGDGNIGRVLYAATTGNKARILLNAS